MQRDHEEGRDQRQLMEGVDEEHVRGEEGAHRAAADQQRGDVENVGTVLDLPHGGQHDQRGEQGEDERDTIRADGEADRGIFEHHAGVGEGEAGRFGSILHGGVEHER
jgi:hypothetical protein